MNINESLKNKGKSLKHHKSLISAQLLNSLFTLGQHSQQQEV